MGVFIVGISATMVIAAPIEDSWPQRKSYPSDAQNAALYPQTEIDPSDEVVPSVADKLSTGANFAGQDLDVEERHITAYWKGEAPDYVREYVESRPFGVTVDLIEGRKYSRVESMSSAVRFAESSVAPKIGVVSASLNKEGTGIKVAVDGDAPDPDLARAAAEIAGLDLADVTYVEHSSLPVPVARNRADDYNPWRGGIRTVQGGLCSTGFAAISAGTGVLLSANHCDPAANARVNDGAGEMIATGGSAVSAIPGYDSQSINPAASPATEARMYTGGWNSSTSLIVKGWKSNFFGDTVCTSGATSGQHCGTITDDAQTQPGLQGSFYVVARTTDVTFIAGGDSGGAVYKSTTGGAEARGIILRGSEITYPNCGYVNPDADLARDRACYKNVIFVPIGTLLEAWGYQLETG